MIKDYNKAIADYSEAIEKAPENYYGYLIRGDAYSREKEYYSAISDYSKVIELKPNLSAVYKERSEAYRLTNQDTKAANDLKMVKKLAPPGYSSRIIAEKPPEIRIREERERRYRGLDNWSQEDRQRMFEDLKGYMNLPKELKMPDYWPYSH